MKIFAFTVAILLTGSLNAQKAETIISYKKGACMGKCPVYSITVDEDGHLVYHGIVNVDKVGIYSRHLTSKELKKVKKKFKRAKFHKLDEKYGMDVMDAPMTTYKYKSPKIDKTIKVKLETPKRLIKAEKYMHFLITDTDEVTYTWKKEKGPSGQFGRKEMAERMIIVQLRADVNIDAWLKKYKSYNVRKLKQIVPNRPLYLLAFNHAKNSTSNATQQNELRSGCGHGRRKQEDKNEAIKLCFPSRKLLEESSLTRNISALHSNIVNSSCVIK